MARVDKTVFISYRRADSWAALAVFNELAKHGYDVFIDYDGIASGDFERSIVDNIRARAHFVLVLTPKALERCDDPADWLRREIEEALAARRNVVPLLLNGFSFDSPLARERLQASLEPLRRYNALKVPEDFFQAAMDRLRSKYLAVPVDAVVHPASEYAQRVAEQQRDAALRASLPTEEQAAAVERRGVERRSASRVAEPMSTRRRLMWGGAAAAALAVAAVLAGPELWFRWTLHQALAEWKQRPDLHNEAKKQTIPVLAQAAERGDTDAMDALADAYGTGKGGVEPDLQRQAYWSKRAVDAGSEHSLSMLAALYQAGDGGLPRDPKMAEGLREKRFRQLQADADRGDLKGMFSLAMALAKGNGAPRDVDASRTWFQKAADGGNEQAAMMLSVNYALGKRGYPQDKQKAMHFLERCAGSGDAAVLWAGGMVRAILFVDQPDSASASLVVGDVARAADMGLVDAMEMLADWHSGESRFSKLRVDPDIAAQWIQRAAETKAPQGTRLLAHAHLRGLSVIPKDEALAKQLLQRAAKAGDAKAAFDWGDVLLSGVLGEAKNETDGLRYLQLAADREDEKARVVMGMAYKEGRFGLRPDAERALRWINQAADHDDGEALFQLAVARSRGELGLAPDMPMAIKLLKEAAGFDGHARAHQQLGRLYEFGLFGVVKDSAQARTWYEGAADHGDGEAALRLYYAFRRGELSAAVDNRKALQWLQRSVDLSFAAGMNELGWVLIKGELGLKADAPRGVAVIRRAADAEDPWAMTYLAGFYLDGTGETKIDVPKAVQLHQAAAKAGNWEAMLQLSTAYANGAGGLSRDPVLSASWRAKGLKAKAEARAT